MKSIKLFRSTKRNNYLEITSDDLYDDNQIYYWILNDKFLGSKLDSYDHSLKFKLFFSILRGDVSIDTYKHFEIWPDLILATNIGNRTISIGYKNFANKFEPEKQNSIELKLNEQNWFKLNPRTNQLTNKPIDALTFKLVLLNLEKFLIRAKYHIDQIESRLYAVQLEHSETVESLLPIKVHQTNLSYENSSNQSATHLNPKFTISKAIKENCTCLQPFTGLSCEKCENGYFMVIHFDDHLTRKLKKNFLFECRPCDCNGRMCDPKDGKCLFDHSTHLDGDKALKQENKTNSDLLSDKTNLINSNKCISGNCFKIGSLNNDHDDCKPGFIMTKNGCLKKNNFIDSQTSHQECVSKLNEKIEEFGFENKFRMVEQNVIKHKPFALLNGFEFRIHQLANENELLIKFRQQFDKVNLELENLTLNFDSELRNSDDLFVLSSQKEKFDTLTKNSSELSKKSENLSFKSELNFVKLIDIRNQINEIIDQLVALKYQRLFDELEDKKFRTNTNVMLKRMKKDFKEDFYLSSKKELNQQLDRYINLNIKLAEFYQKIIDKKEEIINEFNRLLKIDGKLIDSKKFIENELDFKIDSILELNKKLNAQFGLIESIKNNIDEEFAQMEQGIVDASYMNNVSLILSRKLEDNFYEFDYKLNSFTQNQVKSLSDLLIKLQPDNELKYFQMCKVNLMNLNTDLNMIERILTNENINKSFLIDFIINQTDLIYQLHLNLNRFKDLEFYIENEFEQLDLLSMKQIQIDKNLEDKLKEINDVTQNINLELVDLDDKLESNKLRLNTIKNNSFIIDELDGNIKYRNKLLISIEEDLNNLTRKSLISKYIDNFVSPISRLKSAEHNRMLSYLNKELIPDYLKRFANLKENLEIETLNASLNENVQKIYNNINTKKKYIQSFELRNKKIDTINHHVKGMQMITDNLIQQTRQLLSSIKINLGMKYLTNESGERKNCKRTYSINLEPTSLLDVSFFYSVADSTSKGESYFSYFKFENSLSNLYDHSILTIGSLDKQYILFELKNGQIMVSWRFGNSSNHLLSSLKLKKNDETFKNKNAYYKIRFVKSVQEVYLRVRSFKNHEESYEKLEIEDLIINLQSNSLKLGVSNSSKKSTEEFISTISSLRINDDPIGLWNYETTATDYCLPVKDFSLNSNLNEIFIFNGRNSYLQFSQINRYEKHKYSIGIEFRTFVSDGLLFLTFNRSSKDLVAIRLKNGCLEFMIFTRKLKLILQTVNRYDNGIWHALIFDRENYLSIVRIDDDEQLEGCLEEHEDELNFANLNDYSNRMGNKTKNLDCSNSLRKLELGLEYSSIFIGGFGGLDREALFQTKHFNGAIRQIQVESTLINLNNNLNSFNVKESSSTSSLIKQMKFNSAKSFARFDDLQFKNWSNFGFTFRISNDFAHSNCSILSLKNRDSESNNSNTKMVIFSIKNLLQFLAFSIYK